MLVCFRYVYYFKNPDDATRVVRFFIYNTKLIFHQYIKNNVLKVYSYNNYTVYRKPIYELHTESFPSEITKQKKCIAAKTQYIPRVTTRGRIIYIYTNRGEGQTTLLQSTGTVATACCSLKSPVSIDSLFAPEWSTAASSNFVRSIANFLVSSRVHALGHHDLSLSLSCAQLCACIIRENDSHTDST